MVDEKLDENILTVSEENLDKQRLTTIENEEINIPKLSNNQDVNIDRLNNLKYALKSSSQFISCPYCNYQDFTGVEKENNMLNTVFCILSLGTLWGCHQFFRNKDCNCFNAKHTCKKCGQEIQNYKTC